MHVPAARAPARRLLTSVAITVLALVLAMPAASAAPKTKLISQTSGGGQVATTSNTPHPSANGNTVTFVSSGALIGSDTNSQYDAYQRLVGKRKTKLVSRDRKGGLADGATLDAIISANGRYVALSSAASDLTPRHIDAGYQVYRRDLATGKTKLVSRGSVRVADQRSFVGDISASGRYIVFTSAARNLTAKNTQGHVQVYLRDMKTKKTRLISQNGKGRAGAADSGSPTVSADGRFVAFYSHASNLAPKTRRGASQVFLRDRKLGKTYLISRNVATGSAGSSGSYNPALSANGRVIVFESGASNLIKAGRDTNGYSDIYKYDRATKKMKRVSVDWRGRQLTGGPSHSPDVSADGRVIIYGSEATNTIPGGTNGKRHVYRRGPKAGSIKLVDRNNKGVQANGDPWRAKVSADGRYVVFASNATNLTKGKDRNGTTSDVFRTGPF